MAAAAAGRRTDAAIPRFVAAHGFDAEVYSTPPSTGDRPTARGHIGHGSDRPRQRPTEVRLHPSDRSVQLRSSRGQDQRERSLQPGVGPTAGPFEPPLEVVASYTLQHDEGVQLGSSISVPFYSQEARVGRQRCHRASASTRRPDGGIFGVVGFEATELDFPAGATPDYLLWASPAFTRQLLPRVATSHLYFVRLRHGAADLPRFDAAASKLDPKRIFVQNEDAEVASVEASVHPQAIGWWLLAALAALVGLAVVGQALGRQSTAESEEYPTLVALGLERRQLVMLGNACSLAVGLAAAVGAVAIATLLSPIAPLGEARAAETSTGITFDALVLTLGALVTVAIVVALGIWPAVRASRTARASNPIVDAKPSKLPGLLGSMGAPPSMEIGVRNALERRSGGANVPVGSALLGTVLAVVALCGTAVFGASLTHLTATPKLYGDPFQLNISNPNGGRPDPTVVRSLEHDRAVTGLTQGIALPAITIGKVVVGALAGTAVRGSLLMSTVDGRSPDAKGEVGLGGTTMRAVGARVGSVVDVTVSLPSGGKRTVPFRVVGQMSLPVIGRAARSRWVPERCSRWRATRTPRARRVRREPPAERKWRSRPMAVSWRVSCLVHAWAGSRQPLSRPVPVDHHPRSHPDLARQLRGGRQLPTHLRRHVGGIRRRHAAPPAGRQRGAAPAGGGAPQGGGVREPPVASTVAWQATTLALAGIAVGVPVGIVVGRAVWLAFANNLGVVPVSVVPIGLHRSPSLRQS